MPGSTVADVACCRSMSCRRQDLGHGRLTKGIVTYKMGLRIACDLDGTLADLEGALGHEAERLFGPADESRAIINTAPRRRALWARVAATQNFWTTLGEAEPGAVAQLAAASTERGWEVIFLTQRPSTAGDTAQRQSQRWLELHGFAHPSVFVVSGSRGKIAAALGLDVVVDDSPENCLDVVSDSEAASLLVWRSDRTPKPPGVQRLRIEVVSSMADAIRITIDIDERRSARPTTMERVRNALRPLWGAADADGPDERSAAERRSRRSSRV